MDKEKLINIISAGESNSVEFKENFGSKTIITINAFANTKGGSIIIGVSDGGKYEPIV